MSLKIIAWTVAVVVVLWIATWILKLKKHSDKQMLARVKMIRWRKSQRMRGE